MNTKNTARRILSVKQPVMKLELSTISSRAYPTPCFTNAHSLEVYKYLKLSLILKAGYAALVNSCCLIYNLPLFSKITENKC